MKESMKSFAEMAVELAQVMGCTLDYSAESIVPLDALAQILYKVNASGNMREETALITANAFGAYLGETLLRSGLAGLGYDWMENGEGEFGIGMDDTWMAPVTKVYKRITQGPYHCLTDFFEIALRIAMEDDDVVNDPRMHILSEE